MTSFEDVIATKQALRFEMKGRRALLNESERAKASWALCNRLLRFLEKRSERTIGVYLSRPYEISLDPMIAALLHGGYTVAAPRVDVDRDRMSFWRLKSLDEVELGPWNVRQPPLCQHVDEIPLILVPGLAFDASGGRLGTGGGWYDRFAGDANCLVGVTFDCQILTEVPLEDHDLTVDYVASDERWIEVNASAWPQRKPQRRQFRGKKLVLSY